MARGSCVSEPQAVGDVCFGSVMGPSSQRANECRIAMFLAGFPESVPVHTVNRQCSSGTGHALCAAVLHCCLLLELCTSVAPLWRAVLRTRSERGLLVGMFYRHTGWL